MQTTADDEKRNKKDRRPILSIYFDGGGVRNQVIRMIPVTLHYARKGELLTSRPLPIV